MATEHDEDRLRQLLRDDAWSLPAWPDSEVRVRRAARRQRLHAASASVVACALVAAALVLPLRLIGGPAPRSPADAGDRPAASHSATSPPTTQQEAQTPPSVGAPGFPARIYPLPEQAAIGTPLASCPRGKGVQSFAAVSSQRVLAVMARLGRTLTGDLQLTDRSFWPTLLSEWQSGAPKRFIPVQLGNVMHVPYDGPLAEYQPPGGSPDLAGSIAGDCGSWLALSTWLIVTGPVSSPSLQSQLLFLNRAGRVLLYYAQ